MPMSPLKVSSSAIRGAMRPVAVTIALMALSVPLAASAATTQKITASAYGERISVTVPMDLLATDAGTTRLYKALQRKAERSCKTVISQRLGRLVSVDRCSGKLMDGFVAKLDHAGISALHLRTQNSA